MPSQIEFLQHILPPDPYWFGFAAQNKKVKAQGFSNLASLVSWLNDQCANGADAYMACGGFKTIDKRTKTNSAGAKALWTEIDVGEGHSNPSKYATIEEAVVAVVNFCNAVGIALPTIVASGGGIHCYWVLDRVVPPEEWTEVALALKAKLLEHGVDIDPARTADIASVLRLPGTNNYKLGYARGVACGALQPAIAFPEVKAKLLGVTVLNESQKEVLGSIEIGDMPGDDRPKSIIKAAQECNALKVVRDRRGDVKEPLWYGMLCVAAHCQDGESIIHEWSNGYPGYSEGETEKKFEHAKTNDTGPTTCAKFKDIDPTLCMGCPHVLKSPIMLGVEDASFPKQVKIEEPVEDEWPSLPPRFSWGPAHQLIYTPPPKADGTPGIPTTVSQYPIYLDKIQRQEQNDEVAIAFRQFLPHMGWRRFSITAREFYGSNGAAALAANGANVYAENKKLFMTYVQKAQDVLRSVEADQIRYGQFGWKNDHTAFLVGRTLYKADGTTEVVDVSPDAEPRSNWLVPNPKGNLEEWKRLVSPLMQPGWEAQAIGFLSTFGAPMMEFAISDGNGGGVVALTSTEGGTGKSTATFCNASVWGSWGWNDLISRDTVVGQFGSFAQIRNLPIVVEESMKSDAEEMKSFIAGFTVARDKIRGTKEGGLSIPKGGWKTILTTTSNRSIVDLLMTDGESAQATRVFEITCRKPPGLVGNGDTTYCSKINDHAGHAGVVFAKFIVQPQVVASIKKAMPERITYYQTRLNGSTKARFLVSTLAAIDVGARLAMACGLISGDITRIMDWAVAYALAADNAEETKFDSLATLTQMMNDLNENTLIVSDIWKRGEAAFIHRHHRGPLKARVELTPGFAYISIQAVREWCAKNRKPYSLLHKEAKEAGALLEDRVYQTLGAGTEHGGSGRTWSWKLDCNHEGLGGFMRLIPTTGIAPEILGDNVVPMVKP